VFNTKFFVMSVISYVPLSDNDKVTWLNNFDLKLGIHGPGLGIPATEITSVSKDAAMFRYVVNLQETFKQTLQNVTGYKKLLKKANGQQHLSATLPALPSLGTPPAAVPEGIFNRISKLVARIKASAAYTENMGSDLGIIAPVANFDPNSMQPDLKVRLNAGRPHVKWTKGESDALDLFVDRNDDAGYVFAGRFMRNEYLDVTPLAAAKVVDQWSYKGIYVIADQQVGLYSGVVDISVKRS
jgi:hypothetical protein